MSVYAYALAGYSLPYLPAAMRPVASHVISSAALILLGLINYAGSALVEKSEGAFNAGKLAVLALFIVVGLFASGLDWDRLAPAEWASPSAIVASGMIGFLAYEGFELIANASDNIVNPKRTLPIAFLGCVIIAIVVYALAFIVGIGHLPFPALVSAKDFAISAAAASFLGPFGFAIMAIGAVLASASAINADYFGASKLPPQLATIREMPSAFHRSLHGKSVISLAVIGVSGARSRQFCVDRGDVLGDQRWFSARLRSAQHRGRPPGRRDRRQPVHPRPRRPPVPRCARNHDLGIRVRSVDCEPGCRYRRDRARLYRHRMGLPIGRHGAGAVEGGKVIVLRSQDKFRMPRSNPIAPLRRIPTSSVSNTEYVAAQFGRPCS